MLINQIETLQTKRPPYVPDAVACPRPGEFECPHYCSVVVHKCLSNKSR